MTIKDRISNHHLEKRYLDLYAENEPLLDAYVHHRREMMGGMNWKDTPSFYDPFTRERWHDAFDTQWNIGEHWGAYHEDRPYYYWGPPTINNGIASFQTQYVPKFFEETERLHLWKCGGLSSAGYFKQKYGTFEICAKVPTEYMVRSAGWMWSGGEVDMFETDGCEGTQKINVFHRQHKDPTRYRKSIGKVEHRTLRQDKWQIFTFKWTYERMEIFTDGVKVWELTQKRILDWFNDYNQGMWFVIYQTVPWNRLAKVGENIISSMEVDYVAAWE